MSLHDDERLGPEDFRLVVEGSPDLTTVVGTDGLIRYGNPALARALGYPSIDLDGRRAFDFLHGEDVPLLGEIIADAVAGLDRPSRDMRVRHRDDTWRTFEVLGRRFLDGRGRTSAVLHARDVTERRAAEALHVYQAVHDALTGLPNRSAFIDRLERSLSRSQRGPTYSFALFFLDLDRFKLVNDSLGHMTGDQLLVAVARRIAACVRPGDMVAHLGGDEFTLIIDHVQVSRDAIPVAERVRAAFNAPFVLAGHEVFASACMGIALSSTGYERPEDMLRDADTAMYRAKGGGSGRYEFFDHTMHQHALTRLKLETDLRRAVEREELRVHYQPIVTLSTGHISGFEALVRWQHPERGLVPPMEFIPVAEETGLIVPICAWVLKQACIQARHWQDTFKELTPVSVSMNFTSTHFTQPEVMDSVAEALRSADLEGRHLAMEITESVMFEDIDSVIGVLRALKDLDISLHIDDFGTGYSSLSYLHRLPTDALKIDRSFVSRMADDPEAALMVKTIIDLAHNLHREVVAEGIETEAQLRALRSLGCEYGQGYYFARPMLPEDTDRILARDPRW
jgi:diguanylate cyclase (GGDEF)-like protein/PAS domain S-box-containing protein